MNKLRLIISATVITLACVAPAFGKAWRGVVPLQSTREVVERLLGAPQTGTRNMYKTETETVKITYAEGPCAYGWRVPLDTVVSLLIYPTNPLRLSDVRLDERKYEKRKDIHLDYVYYYISEAEGLTWTVDTAQGLVTSVEYYPSTRDSRLKCSRNSTGEIRAASKSRIPVKTRAGKKTKPGSVPGKFACPMHPDYVSSKPGTCPRCGMTLRSVTATSSPNPTETTSAGTWSSLSSRDLVLEMERLAPNYEYTCLMHPGVHEAQPGLCPKCGMPLTIVQPSVRGEYKFLMSPEPQSPRPGENVLLRFTISNPQSGERVTDYVINHEKLFHLFIVSQDLSEYQHIHPTIESDGTFSVETILPRAGLYRLHADFFPIGGMPQIIHRELVTAGYSPSGVSPPPALTPDVTLVKTLDGMKITLEPGGPLVAGTLVPLTYHLSDSQTGTPVRDLEPYLGAWGHTLILSADQSDYLHTHPSEMLPSGTDRSSLRGGPDVEFKAMFPAAGDYRIWTQFQRAGKVTTVSFTVRVKR